MFNYKNVINTIYPEDNMLRDILMTHSKHVADMAREIAMSYKDKDLDADFVYVAAMLHDIGIIMCDAPGIECHGKHPYICHGILGAELLRKNYAIWNASREEIEKYARVCERHTGTGLTCRQIKEKQLPLPSQDFLPETIEEKIICYADKFFSKTRPHQKKTFEEALVSLQKFGEQGVETFRSWHSMFNIE